MPAPSTQPVADLGVLAQRGLLRLVELARLLQDAVGDRDLAQVVQQAGQPQLLDLLRGSSISRAMPSTTRLTDSECWPV